MLLIEFHGEARGSKLFSQQIRKNKNLIYLYMQATMSATLLLLIICYDSLHLTFASKPYEYQFVCPHFRRLISQEYF